MLYETEDIFILEFPGVCDFSIDTMIFQQARLLGGLILLVSSLQKLLTTVYIVLIMTL